MHDDEQDDRDVDHQPVCERVRHPAEARLHLPAACQPAVHLVGDPGGAEEDRRDPAVPALRGEQGDCEERDQGQPQNRQRVRNVRERSRDRGRGHGSRIEPGG